MALCRFCLFLLMARLERSNATVRWTVACRRLDGGNTSIFFPPGRKCKRVSPLGPKCYKSLLRFIAFFVCKEDCKDVIDRNCSIVFTSANNTCTSCCRTFIISSLFDNWQHFLPYTFITISLVNYHISSHCQFLPFLL